MTPADHELLVETIKRRLASVQERIEKACARVGRAPADVTLVAVTKTFPPSVVSAAVAAGLSDFGENRVQELITKTDAAPGQVLGGTIRWHLIGPLQRNKAKAAARRADVFHALDSLRVAEALNSHAEMEGRVLPCMVQVNVSNEGTKSGVMPERLSELLDGLGSFANLRFDGLMALVAQAQSPDELETVVRPQFQRLRNLAETSSYANQLRHLSMGMSGDFEIAIEEGATHVRLGSVLFGVRGG